MKVSKEELDSCIRCFYDFNLSYYYYDRKFVYEIMFGLYHDDRSTIGEIGMRWYKLNHDIVPKLESFGDTWFVLNELSDVIQKLSEVDSIDITPDDFKNILCSLGFQDKTEYVQDKEENDKILKSKARQRKIGNLIDHE